MLVLSYAFGLETVTRFCPDSRGLEVGHRPQHLMGEMSRSHCRKSMWERFYGHLWKHTVGHKIEVLGLNL